MAHSSERINLILYISLSSEMFFFRFSSFFFAFLNGAKQIFLESLFFSIFLPPFSCIYTHFHFTTLIILIYFKNNLLLSLFFLFGFCYCPFASV